MTAFITYGPPGVFILPLEWTSPTACIQGEIGGLTVNGTAMQVSLILPALSVAVVVGTVKL